MVFSSKIEYNCIRISEDTINMSMKINDGCNIALPYTLGIFITTPTSAISGFRNITSCPLSLT